MARPPSNRPLRFARSLARLAPLQTLRALGVTREGSVFMRGLGRVILPGPGKTCSASVGSMTFELPPDSPSALPYLLGRYEPEVTAWFNSTLKPGMTFVDGGAFAGYYTLLGAGLVGAGGRVWAFEPDPRSFSFLVKNIERNQLSWVTPVELAISDHEGTGSWSDGGRERGRLVAEGTGRTTQTTSLDAYFDLVGWWKVDVIKLDIEAGEAPAVRGLKNIVAANPGIRVLVEVLPLSHRVRMGYRLEHLVEACADVGLTRGRVIERNGAEFNLSMFPDPPEGRLYNLVMSR